MGAKIERGMIAEIAGGLLTVRSLDRDGVLTPPLGALTDGNYSVGDLVFFFVFDDGTGLVLCKMA